MRRAGNPAPTLVDPCRGGHPALIRCMPGRSLVPAIRSVACGMTRRSHHVTGRAGRRRTTTSAWPLRRSNAPGAIREIIKTGENRTGEIRTGENRTGDRCLLSPWTAAGRLCEAAGSHAWVQQVCLRLVRSGGGATVLAVRGVAGYGWEGGGTRSGAPGPACRRRGGGRQWPDGSGVHRHRRVPWCALHRRRPHRREVP
jgi:hypothetical protein